MPDLSPHLTQVLAAIDARPDALLIALAGPPGGGKSTLAQALSDALNARDVGSAVILPIDGYHLDNAVLDVRGWRARKGAPHTFDVGGFARDLARVRAGTETVYAPVFDRALDLARNAAQAITPAHRFVIVEGNYLLLNQTPWNSMSALFDLRVFLRIRLDTLTKRLEARWRNLGCTEDVVQARAHGNDLPNARLVLDGSGPADVVLQD